MYKFIVFFLSFWMLGCSSYNTVDQTPSVKGEMKDTDNWYDDMKDMVLPMRLTIPQPNDYNCTDVNNTDGLERSCTLADVDSDVDATDDYKPVLHVNIQTDDFVSNQSFMNASFQIKGKSTRRAEQKSYRIKLDSKEDLYRGERTFQLNKHPYDDSRVRNKLSFDLFRSIPNFPSMKTEFIHLEINGIDYGLYTHVEKVGKEYLINRGWNEDDNLYKAQDFAFLIYDELKMDSKGKPVDPDAFDSRLEIESGKDHTALDNMLKDINNPKADFQETFEKYFNRDNYLTWMAINIILGNKDTISQNFYLYNPKYSETFYFLPWDYDGAYRDLTRLMKWQYGIGNWWGIPLHRRFLSIEENRNDLYKMVEKIKTEYITPEIVQNHLDTYRPLIENYLLREPDDMRYEKWDTEFNILIPRIEEVVEAYEAEFGHPMPYWIGAAYEDKTLSLHWGKSVDLEGDLIIYRLQVSSSPDMSNSFIDEDVEEVFTKDDENIYYEKEIALEPGIYYMKVVAREIANPDHYQAGFNKEVRVDGLKQPGVLEFEVK